MACMVSDYILMLWDLLVQKVNTICNECPIFSILVPACDKCGTEACSGVLLQIVWVLASVGSSKLHA